MLYPKYKKPVYISIMGNMGPEASELAIKAIRLGRVRRGARKDQDHIPITLINNPNIADRTAHILYPKINPSPVNEMVNAAKAMEGNSYNPSYLGWMPCNTAHYFRDDVQKETNIYILDMLKETVDSLPQEANVAHLATTGTVESRIYDKYFKEKGIEYYTPNAQDQETYVHSAIYGNLNKDGSREPVGLKAGVKQKNAELLSEIISKMKDEHGINTVNLGCTELPIVEEELQRDHPNISFVNPMQCQAEALNNLYELIQEKLANDDISGKITSPKDVQNHDHEQIADYVAYKVING